MSNITKKFGKGFMKSVSKPIYGFGYGISSISNWEKSFFGGFYRTLSDYPDIKISDNIEFDSAALDLPWHLKDKLLKMFLSKVKTHNYQEELLKNAKTEKVELFFQGVCIKTTLDVKSKADVIGRLIRLSAEKEFAPMFDHYRKFILDSELYFLTPVEKTKSKSGGEGNQEENKEENSGSGKDDFEKEKSEKKSEDKKSEGKEKSEDKKEDKKSEGEKDKSDKKSEEKSEGEKEKSEGEKDKSEDKKSEGEKEKQESEEKPGEGKEGGEKDSDDETKTPENKNSGSGTQEEKERESEEREERESKERELEAEEKKREEKRKEKLKVDKAEIDKNIKNFLDAIKAIIEREPHQFLSDLSGFNKNIRVKIEAPSRSNSNPFDQEHIRNAETLVKMLDISFDNANDIVKNLRIGKLDISKIAEVPAGNVSVYKQEVENQITRPFSVAILCDESGSMSGDRIRSQLSIVKSLYLAFSDLLPQDKIFVYGHSGSTTPELYVYHDPHNQNFITTIDNMMEHEFSQNYDGPIIEEVYKTIRSMSNDKIIFIVLSDGQPSGHGYGSNKDILKMKQIVEKCKRDEFVTIGIGIQTMSQKNLYHYSIVVNNLSDMAKKVSHIVNHTVKSEFQ